WGRVGTGVVDLARWVLTGGLCAPARKAAPPPPAAAVHLRDLLPPTTAPDARFDFTKLAPALRPTAAALASLHTCRRRRRSATPPILARGGVEEHEEGDTHASCCAV
ncbi:unnamed protein product, partial [Urochloa humidicola]